MNAALHVLSVLVLVGSGVGAGVLFAVALSTVPALALMPPDRFVYAHTLLGRNWDPTMPAIVLGSAVLDVALAVCCPGTASRVLTAVAAACLAGVSIVSHFRNVPINRQVHRTDPDAIPPGWRDPRPVWRRWHLLRTVLAVLALTANGAAISLLF